MRDIASRVFTFIDDIFWLSLRPVFTALDDPIIFMFVVAVPLVGIGIGIFNRLKSA